MLSTPPCLCKHSVPNSPWQFGNCCLRALWYNQGVPRDIPSSPSLLFSQPSASWILLNLARLGHCYLGSCEILQDPRGATSVTSGIWGQLPKTEESQFNSDVLAQSVWFILTYRSSSRYQPCVWDNTKFLKQGRKICRIRLEGAAHWKHTMAKKQLFVIRIGGRRSS